MRHSENLDLLPFHRSHSLWVTLSPRLSRRRLPNSSSAKAAQPASSRTSSWGVTMGSRPCRVEPPSDLFDRSGCKGTQADPVFTARRRCAKVCRGHRIDRSATVVNGLLSCVGSVRGWVKGGRPSSARATPFRPHPGAGRAARWSRPAPLSASRSRWTRFGQRTPTHMSSFCNKSRDGSSGSPRGSKETGVVAAAERSGAPR